MASLGEAAGIDAPLDTAGWLEHVKSLIRGRNLEDVTLGSTRKSLSEKLGLGRRGLEDRKSEVRDTIEQAVLELHTEAASAAADQPPSWLTVADDEMRSQIFLITFSACLNREDAALEHGLPPPRNPSELSKVDLRDAVLDSIRNPAAIPTAGRPRQEGLVQPHTLVLGQEPHESRPGETHMHVACKIVPHSRFLPMKLALRNKHGLASHWSTSHTQLWSAVRYITTATDKKHSVDPSPLVWTAAGGGLNLYEASQEPWNAKAVKRRREEAALGPKVDCEAISKGRSEVKKGKADKDRFGKLDFMALVVAEGLHTPEAVMSYVQEKGSVTMQSFVAKQQRRLKDYIEDAREWDKAKEQDEDNRMHDVEILQRMARKPCTCGTAGCAWWAAASGFFVNNTPSQQRPGVDRQYLAATILAVIATGPSKLNRVPCILGPSNSGKSTIMDPVRAVFGEGAVFNKPKLGASCPLSRLLKGNKRFIYFDDYRPVEYARLPRENPTLSVLTFIAMFQGQPFEVQVSQSFNDGHPEIAWKRGAALTGPLDGFWEPRGLVVAEDVRHIQSRVVQFEAHHVIPTSSFASVPLCPESWSRWVLRDSELFAMRLPAQVSSPPLPYEPMPELPLAGEACTSGA